MNWHVQVLCLVFFKLSTVFFFDIINLLIMNTFYVIVWIFYIIFYQLRFFKLTNQDR